MAAQRFIGVVWVGILLCPTNVSLGAAELNLSGIEFFERKIRPLFAEHCFSCHGPEKQKGELRLDSPASILAGGEGGPILLPGKPEASRLIQAVRYQDKDFQMPPKERLSDRQVAALVEWINLGAPMPEGHLASGAHPARREFKITAEDRAYWAFQPVQRPAIPEGSSPARASPIDVLVLAQSKAKGLTLNPPATPRELIRRVYFGLIGLPPPPEEVEAFENDPSEERYQKLIDRLLASPQYGERWARHWLDVARFAQSNGYERDAEKPLAWRYRDYVINAFNEDKPYDRFVMEQIAGDELPDATAESVVATAFQRLGVWDDEPDDKRMAEFDALDDTISSMGAAFLGLTVGCARCHDHKFDPISQTDYYSLLAFFRGVRPYENKRDSFDAPGFAPLAAPRAVEDWLAKQKAKLTPLEGELAAATDEKEKKRLQDEIKKLKAEDPFEWTLAVREKPGPLPATHVLIRGNASIPGPEVEPAFFQVLGGVKPRFSPPAPGAASSGRRLALAQWIASPQNPLTARVMVNRIWHHHFGKGLVSTTSDFGRAGAAPTHPELLDWLAAEFVAGGWSMKKLHRLILLSRTYRQSSRADNPDALAADPGNHLLWRQHLRRLEAEAVRDMVLSVAGTLNPRMGGRGFFPHLSGEVLAGQSRPGLDWEVSSDPEQSRRSIYAFVRRTMPVPLLESLDYNNTTSPLAERSKTTVAPQALMLLNDDFMQRQAAAFAERLLREVGGNSAAQVRRAFRLAVNREPTDPEMGIALALLRRQARSFARLSSRLTFRLDVASALATDYFNQLQPSQFLHGPREGWSYHRGFWAPPYEGIRVVDRQRAPFALWQGAPFRDGVIDASVLLSKSSEFAGILFRARSEGDLLHGDEVILDARRQQVLLLRHSPQVAAVLQADATVPTGTPIQIRIEMRGSRITVSLQGEPKLVLEGRSDEPPAQAGRIGVRTWGGPLNLDTLSLRMVSDDGETQFEIDPDPVAPARQALQSFCLLVLNLNEAVYID